MSTRKTQPQTQLPDHFVDYWRWLVRLHGRAAARTYLLAKWDLWNAGRTRFPIPGYRECPAATRHGYPLGWSPSSLSRLLRSESASAPHNA